MAFVKRMSNIPAGLVDEARDLRGRLGLNAHNGQHLSEPRSVGGALRIAGGLSDAAETSGRDIDFARRLASVRAVH